jgi:nucleotide-binding universal stress UspA family protein
MTERRLRRILYPSDFSRASGAAFARAVAMAKADRAQLLLVHVLAPQVLIAGEGYISPKVYDDLEASARSYAQKRLGALKAKARKAGVKAITLLEDGVAHERIARTAKSRKVDLIVIGTHGRTGLAKFFLGSVASRVLAAAPCPVLTVRGK